MQARCQLWVCDGKQALKEPGDTRGARKVPVPGSFWILAWKEVRRLQDATPAAGRSLFSLHSSSIFMCVHELNFKTPPAAFSFGELDAKCAK